MKILAKDLFEKKFKEKGLSSLLGKYNAGECKYFDFYVYKSRKNITYILSLYFKSLEEIKKMSKKTIEQNLKKYFNGIKKEIFKSVSKDLKNIDIENEKYKDMIKTLKGIYEKYFIVEKGQDVEEMIKDIFNELKTETNYDRYLTSIYKSEILYDVRFHDFERNKNKDEEEYVEESDEEEGVEESDEEEGVEKSDEEDKNGYLYDGRENKNRGSSGELNSVSCEQMLKIMNGYKEEDIKSDENYNFGLENNFNLDDFFNLNLKNENNDNRFYNRFFMK